MTELTAETLKRGGSAASGDDIARRRNVAKQLRAAREKLTSSSGLERTYEYELARLFAQYHGGSSVLLLTLASVVASVGSLWVPIALTSGWLLLMVLVLGTRLVLAQRFLGERPDDILLAEWRRRFIVTDLITGLAWAASIQVLSQLGQPSSAFILFIVLMISAVTATLSATIPSAVYFGIMPLGAVTLGIAANARDLSAVLLVAMVGCALAFFLILANRLYGNAVQTIQSRSEKDAIFAELEQAKANSDEARRRAEEANLAKSRFLATMSHELRTPLNAILGFSEVMKNEVFGAHATPHYRDYSADIHGSGEHLLNLINEILDLSRIEAGRYELNEEALHLAHVVAECRHMLNLRAKAKGQTVREFLDPSLPRLWADERAVRQVVLNILSNAIKFTPQGGEITVKVGWTSSGGQYLSVRDNGPGIPEDEIGVVMSSFGRGSLAIKTAEQGSGLGLPIVKGLVDLHGGGFQLKSRPREGTEVIVTFPTTRAIDALAALEIESPELAPARSQAGG